MLNPHIRTHSLQKMLYICGVDSLIWTNVAHAPGKGPIGSKTSADHLLYFF